MDKTEDRNLAVMQTLTVSELITALSEYPRDMPVLATWEGVNADIVKDDFRVKPVFKYGERDCLVIDVENYG